MITKLPYSLSEARLHLDAIASLMPDAIGIRNDPLVSSRYTFPVCINTAYLEMDGGKAIQIKIPETLDEASEKRLLPNVQERLGLDEDAAAKFVHACVSLQKLNNIGAWPLKTSQMEPMVATEVEVGNLAYEQGNYLNEAIMYLGEVLPSTNTLAIEYCQLTRGPKWRAWVSFMREADGVQLASIDTSAISLHLEASLTRRAAKLREVNAERIRGWAEQLGCNAVQMPKILHLLTLFVASLSLTRVELD